MGARKGTRPPNAGIGREKGVPNKVTTDVKEMIVAALDGVGGEKYLIARAKDPRTASAFLTLVGRVLPRDLNVKASISLADIVRQAREQVGK